MKITYYVEAEAPFIRSGRVARGEWELKESIKELLAMRYERKEIKITIGDIE